MDIDLFPDTIHRTTMLEHVDAAQQLCELARPHLRSTDQKSLTTLVHHQPIQGEYTWNAIDHPLAQPLIRSVAEYTRAKLHKISYRIYTVYVQNMWFNLMTAGASQAAHNHYGYSFSAVYYAHVPDRPKAKLVFQNPVAQIGGQILTDDDEQSLRGRYARQYFETGDLVLFPSHLIHGVPPVEGEGERWSMAFDIVLRNRPQQS